jgi:hypothetical protein
MLQYVLEFPSFWRLSNILIYVYTTFCPSVHLWIDIWVLEQCCHKYWCTSLCWVSAFYSLGYRPRSRTVGSYDNLIFNLLRKCQNGFHEAAPFYHFTFPPAPISRHLHRYLSLCMCVCVLLRVELRASYLGGRCSTAWVLSLALFTNTFWFYSS